MASVKVLPNNPFQENTYILYDETGECAIIDPGMETAGEQNRKLCVIRDGKTKAAIHRTDGHAADLSWLDTAIFFAACGARLGRCRCSGNSASEDQADQNRSGAHRESPDHAP